MFEFFDPNEAVQISKGTLPHWYQPEVTYFVTFRTEDSIPPKVADLWHRRRKEWLRQHGVDPDRKDWKIALERLTPQAQTIFHRTFSREFLEYLDRGYGEMVLRRAELAQVIAESLRHFDGDRYVMSDFVVMPNHVHLLVGLLGDTDIEEQCYLWKKYTAGKINRLLGRRGRFWHEESFDHLVRSAEDFERFRIYIANNGIMAGLRHGEYLYWRRT